MNDVDQLIPYMLTCKNISKFTRYIDKPIKMPKPKPFKNKEPSNSIFIPYQEDKLFWIFFFIDKGYVEYNMVGSNSYSTEMDTKILLVSELKQNKSIFKDYKLKKITDSVNELLSSSEISFKTFELICIIKHISIIIIKDNMYHKILFDDSNEVYIIHVVNSMYGCEKINMDDVKNYEMNRYHIENYDKPIKCAGSFKVDELRDLAKTLNVEIDDKMKKQDLYQLVASKVNSFFDK